MGYLFTFLIYIATVARAIGWNQDNETIPAAIWILLTVFGLFLFSQQVITRKFPNYPRLYIVIQSVLVVSMLYNSPTLDFLPLLLLPLSFQAVEFFHSPIGFIWISILLLAMSGMILLGLEWQAGLTMILTGCGISFLVGSFAHLITRTEIRRKENQRLLADLQKAYHALRDSAAQTEALAAAVERHRLVRELHDSLTQTLFSMNLAVQSAQLALEDDPDLARSNINRLQFLTRSAASEVQSLTGQTPFSSFPQGELTAAFQQLALEKLERDGLQVRLEISGDRVFPRSVEVNLYRIAQEALNNVVRHAGVNLAVVRLHLESPAASLEIEDDGSGFFAASTNYTDSFGLMGMEERAREINWSLVVKSIPGKGTVIHVEENKP